MTGARLPKMKKSYHSNAVPADEAMMTRAIDQGLWCDRSPCRHVSPRGEDSSAAASVQLADGLVEVGEGEAEALGRRHDWRLLAAP